MKKTFFKGCQSFADSLGDENILAFLDFLSQFDDGTEMEVIVRKKLPWDISRMRKFFEGPVCAFVLAKINERRIEGNERILNKVDVREGLKALYIGTVEIFGGRFIAHSTTTLDYKSWVQFLKNIDEYCIENFGQGLPEAEE